MLRRTRPPLAVASSVEIIKDKYQAKKTGPPYRHVWGCRVRQGGVLFIRKDVDGEGRSVHGE
eukprot:4333318-Pyramimonas_sp.AAC.1